MLIDRFDHLNKNLICLYVSMTISKNSKHISIINYYVSYDLSHDVPTKFQHHLYPMACIVYII